MIGEHADPGVPSAPEVSDERVRAALQRAQDAAIVDVHEAPAVFQDVYGRLSAALTPSQDG